MRPVHAISVIRRSATLRYGIALLVVVASAEIRWLLNPMLGDNGPYLLFMPGVMIVALTCGLGPGLFATVIASLTGMFFWIEPHFSFVIGSYDELVHAASSVVVGTAISILSHYVQKSRRSQELANLAKDRFFAVLSHELRQPMAPIMTAIDALEDTQRMTEAERQDAIQVIRRNFTLHSRLIEDLLDVNRISAGKLSLRRHIHDLNTVLRSAADACLPEIRSKNLRLELQLQAIQTWINGDPVRLQQVFWNLLRNATKFTPEGGTITLRSSNAGQRLRIDVQDTGVGIDRARLSSLFVDFEQAHGEMSMRLGGLGLGLAICKGVVRLHGGEISATSDGPGKGATFSVVLPTCPTPAAAVAPAPTAAGKRILLVDDQPDTLRLLAMLLRHAGYDVSTADSVRSALDAAGHGVELLISDLQLGDGTGADLLRRMREHGPVKAICLSGAIDTPSISHNLEAGFCRHISKPVAFPQLRQVIEEVLLAQDHAAQ